MKGRKLRVINGVAGRDYAYAAGIYDVPTEVRPEIADDLVKAKHAEWLAPIERETIAGETPEKPRKAKG